MSSLVAKGYVIVSQFPCALFSVEGTDTIFNWAGMLFTVVPGMGYNSQGVYCWDGTLNLYARNEQAKQNLNCEINELRGYIENVEETEVTFWLTKAMNPWDNQFEVTANYYYSHSARDFIAEVIKGPVP